MVASLVAIGFLVVSDHFSLDEADIELSGLRYTDPVAVRQTIGVPAGSAPNVFLLRTERMRRDLEALPAVAEADVRALLPGRLVVEVRERSPVIAVTRGGSAYLVDGDGVVLDRLDRNEASIADLPAIDDERLTLSVEYELGGRLDATESAAMLQLGAITPALLDSAATSLAVSVDDHDGYVIEASPAGWRAVFGHYTPTLRPPAIIAQQVHCLRSLIADTEAAIDTVYLAPLDERCGTYLPTETPEPTAHESVRVSVPPTPST